MREWPEWLQRMALQEKKNNRERFTYFYFLTVNGMSPDIAGQWTLLYDVKGGQEIMGEGYDKSARAQIVQMKEQIRKKIFFTQDKRMYDMHTRQVIPYKK